MIEATPSMMKKATSTIVSENAPLTGNTSSIAPTAIPSTAETSAHQKPGAWRIQKVVIRSEGDQHNCERERAAHRQHKQHRADRDPEHGRNQRPPEARRLAHPESRDQIGRRPAQL